MILGSILCIIEGALICVLCLPGVIVGNQGFMIETLGFAFSIFGVIMIILGIHTLYQSIQKLKTHSKNNK